jgi:hypothetical protein
MDVKKSEKKFKGVRREGLEELDIKIVCTTLGPRA